MEDLVLTIEQCKHLQELGLDMSDSKNYWVVCSDNNISVVTRNKPNFTMSKLMLTKDIIPTYTLQEIWEKLPPVIITSEIFYLEYDFVQNIIQYLSPDKSLCLQFFHKSKLENFYEMLCWVIKKEYL